MVAHSIPNRLSRRIASRSHAVTMLQIFAVAVFVFPSDLVIKAVGGAGYVAALIAYLIFLAWVAATLFGLHNPLEHRYPVRIALCGLWLVSLASYAVMNRGNLTIIEQTAADRWIMQLAGVSGVILVTAECLRSLEDIRRVIRALTWGAAFCGIVAALQFWLGLDITVYLRKLPGFSPDTTDYTTITTRDALNRVSGTAIHPIELGVVAGMMLPLAVYLAMNDSGRSKERRWIPVFCIALAIPVSVSRSAILAVGVSLGVVIIMLPPIQRLKALAVIPLALVGVFMTAHGLIGTLKAYFLAGSSDQSIANRVNNYPLVEQLVHESPWLGSGGGTYIAQDAVHILDNEYLTTAIALGLIGLAALIFFFLWPAVAALVARRRTADPELRDLCAALAGSELAAVLCSATFDSLSFPMFVSVQAIIAGLIGAAWLVVHRERETTSAAESWSKYSNGTIDRRRRVLARIVQQRGGN